MSAPQVDITQGGLLGKLLRHGSLYLLSSLISKFAALALLPVNTRLFTETEYGAIANIDATTRLLTIFISLYLDSAFVRYYFEYRDDEATLSRYISTLFWFIAGWGTAVVLVAMAVVAPLADTYASLPVVAMAFVSTLLIQLGLLGTVYLQQSHRSREQVSFNLGNLIIQITLLLLLVGVFGLGLKGKYVGLLCGTGYMAVRAVWVLRREGMLRWQFDITMLKGALIYSLPLLPNIAGGWIAGFSDRLILTWYGSLADTGIYSVGYSLGQGISVFSQAIFMVYGPMIFAMIKSDRVVARERIERFVPYFFMYMLWMSVAVSIFSSELIAILTPARYAAAARVVPIVIFAYFLGSQYKVFSSLLSYEHRNLLISVGAIFQAIINLGANLLLVPIFGQLAAAWTTVLSSLFYLLWLAIWSQRSFFLQIDYRRTGVAVLILALTFWLGWLSEAAISGLRIAAGVKILILVASLALLWVTGCILPVDKVQLRQRAYALWSKA